MNDSELREFLDVVFLLESCYRVTPDKRLSQAEAGNYFRQMRQFPIDVVTEAAERVPSLYPSFFPKAGEWRLVCEQVSSEIQYAAKARSDEESRREYLMMIHCAHQFVEEPEPPGGLFVKFDVCIYCGLAKPTLNRDVKFARQRNYLTVAISAKPQAVEPLPEPELETAA